MLLLVKWTLKSLTMVPTSLDHHPCDFIVGCTCSFTRATTPVTAGVQRHITLPCSMQPCVAAFFVLLLLAMQPCVAAARVTDDLDRRCLMSILRQYITPGVVHQEQAPLTATGSYIVPQDGGIETYREYIKTLPR